jgi:hypothetical protein
MLFLIRKAWDRLIRYPFQLVLPFIWPGVDPSPMGCFVFLALTAVLSLAAWAFCLQRRLAIANTPTSRIASAAQGYVEISGAGQPSDPPLFSPLTGRHCLWYSWKGWVENDGKHEKTQGGESHVPFVIDDGSGRCVIDPMHAEILTQHKESWSEEDIRYTEWTLLPGDDIYALGEFRTLGGDSTDLDARKDLNTLLGEWKKNRRALLKRFDLDGDGEISEKEWGLARRAARREVARRHSEIRNEPNINTLGCPANGRLFLLSNLDPNRLARRYLLYSIMHLTIFLTALGAIPWSYPIWAFVAD